MKNLLLGSTAAVAVLAMANPASAADPVKLSLGGYFAGFAAFIDDDSPAGTRDYAFGHDSEVHFKGKTTLDNGIKVGFKAELELEDDSAGAGSSSDMIDEVYIDFTGGFGMVRFGQDDGVSSSMRISTPTPFMRIGADDVEDVKIFDALVEEVQLETEIGDDDATKIIYNTPRLAGFQVGVSFAPDSGKSAQGLTDRVEGSGDEKLEFGINYEHEVNGMSFGIAGLYYTDSRVGSDDPDHFNIGATLGVSGFTLGANYTWGDNLVVNGAAYSSTREAKIWSIGGVYENGPWSFGLQYADGKDDTMTGASDEDSYSQAMGGVNYEFGPAITIGAGVMYGSFEDVSSLPKEEGTAFFVETGLKF